MRNATATAAAATVAWLVYGLIFAEQLVNMERGGGLSWHEAIERSLVGLVACWIPLTIGLVAVVRRFPLERGRLRAGVVATVLAVAAVLTLRAFYVWALDPVLGYWYDATPPFGQVLSHSVRFNFMLAWLIVGVAHAWVYAGNVRAGRLRIARLEAGLAQARLDALAAQLNPHFLFNALNAIAELIHHDPDAADGMLVALSALLRRSLAQTPGEAVRVEEELALLRQYLVIEQLRFGDRLSVRIAADADCRDARVPPLMLQPLAENAIVHGIGRRRGAGTLHVEVRRAGGRLRVEVRDEGAVAAAAPVASGHGIGLDNLRGRLRVHYAEDWALELQTGPTHSIVRIDLPLHIARESEPAAPAIAVPA